MDREFRVLYVNKAAEARAGAPGEAIIGRKCYEVFDKTEAPPSFCPARTTFETGKRQCVVRECMAGRNGPGFDEIQTAPLTNGGVPPGCIVERTKDVTYEKRLEHMLAASDRQAILGELVAGIAHEVNNPLGLILGFAQDLLTEVRPDQPAYQGLKIIEEEATRCSHVMRGLMEFVRPMEPRFVPSDLAVILTKSLQMVSIVAKKRRVAVARQIPDDFPCLWLDPRQIQQVFVNLFLNAIDAMPEGGQLSISFRMGTWPRPEGADHRTPPVCVEIAISDTGHGIKEEDLPKVLLPFYTTKPNGVGLGLYVSKQIIEAHRGTLSVGNTFGKGATFTIRLPVQRGAEDNE